MNQYKRRKKKRCGRLFVNCFISSLFFASSVFSFSISEYEKRISEYALPNGMQFIILEDHTAPVVSFVVCVNTGSVDEKTGETGISHLIEHLAFNGTEKVGTKDWKEEKKVLEKMDRLYEKMLSLTGSSLHPPHPDPLPYEARENKSTKNNKIVLLMERFKKLKEKADSYGEPNEFGKILDKNGAVGPNAYTSNDITIYWVELPSNKVELWASLESDRLFSPVFRSFYDELEVVKEERRMRTENSPWGKLMEEFHKTAFTVHPYRNPVIGYKEDLEYMTRGKVKEFYKKHYVPSNITVVIAGDVEKEKLIPIIERYFGKIPTSKRVVSSIPAEPPMEDTVKRTMITMDSEPIFLTAFHIPDINHPDIYALDILAEVLAGGRTSRLYKHLVKEDKIAISTGAWCRSAKYPSLFYIWAIPAKGHTNKEVEDAVIEEIERMKKEGINEEELEGAKERLTMEVITGLKERRGLAEELAIYKVLTGNWRGIFRYIEKIEKVNAEDVMAVMERYIRTDRRIVGTVER